jgi:hypothetical protein
MRAHQVGKLVHEVKTVRRTCGAGRGIFATLAWRSAHLTATASILSRCEIVLALASLLQGVRYGEADALRKSDAVLRVVSLCPRL